MADIHKIELFGSCYNPSLPMFVIITKNIKISKFYKCTVIGIPAKKVLDRKKDLLFVNSKSIK